MMALAVADGVHLTTGPVLNGTGHFNNFHLCPRLHHQERIIGDGVLTPAMRFFELGNSFYHMLSHHPR